jgi:hypothetical protein
MAKEDKGMLGGRRVIQLKKKYPTRTPGMPTVFENPVEELAKSLEAEGAGRPLSISRPSGSDSDPSSVMQSGAQTPTSFHSNAMNFLSKQ